MTQLANNLRPSFMCLARQSTEGSTLPQCHQAPSCHPHSQEDQPRERVSGSCGWWLCINVEGRTLSTRGCRTMLALSVGAEMKVGKLCEPHLLASPFLPLPSSCSILATQPGSSLPSHSSSSCPSRKEIHPLAKQVHR